ncbi:hypothetical protein ACS0TY_026482 [Phlomoides rotata]
MLTSSFDFYRRNLGFSRVIVLPEPVYMSFVNAKCSRQERIQLWHELRDIVASIEDRSGEMAGFTEAVVDCELVDTGCVGSPFT